MNRKSITNKLSIVLTAILLLAGCGNTGKTKAGEMDERDTSARTIVTPNAPPVLRVERPNGFVSVTDLIPDAELEIRYYTTNNFVGRQIDGYEAPIALLSRPAADSLKAVADELRMMGYRLKIYDAYRPQRAVDMFMRWVEDKSDTLMKQQYYPKVSKSRMVGKYIARRSAHTRGAAVDLTLVDADTGEELDMGGTFDWFGEESRPSYCGDPERGKYKPRKGGLTEEQFKHRMMLRAAMTAHGFRAITSEWWHFSLKNEPFPRTYFNFPVK